jgi:hypothetical protein
MQPDPSVLMFPWYVWSVLIIGTFLMMVIGTWLIARRWKE